MRLIGLACWRLDNGKHIDMPLSREEICKHYQWRIQAVVCFDRQKVFGYNLIKSYILSK